jgi:alcohol dehydrogenase, propanol-preferring
MVQQLAQLAGAEVTVVARAAGHLALAKKLGARTIDSSKGDVVDVLRKSGGVDAAIVFAPSTALLREAIRGTKPGGVIVVGALADVGELPFVEEKTGV